MEARDAFLLKEIEATALSLVTHGCCVKVAAVVAWCRSRDSRMLFSRACAWSPDIKQWIFITEHAHDLSSQIEQKHFHCIFFKPNLLKTRSHCMATDDIKLAIPVQAPEN